MSWLDDALVDRPRWQELSIDEAADFVASDEAVQAELIAFRSPAETDGGSQPTVDLSTALDDALASNSMFNPAADGFDPITDAEVAGATPLATNSLIVDDAEPVPTGLIDPFDAIEAAPSESGANELEGLDDRASFDDIASLPHDEPSAAVVTPQPVANVEDASPLPGAPLDDPIAVDPVVIDPVLVDPVIGDDPLGNQDDFTTDDLDEPDLDAWNDQDGSDDI